MNNIKIRIYILWFAFALFFFAKFFVMKASATTYYVAANGSDNHAGSYNSPFRTIQKAADVVGTGDTVMVREGKYAGFTLLDVNGTSSSPVVLMCYPGEHVIIDRKLGAAPSSGNTFVVMIEGGSYIEINGFEIMDQDALNDRISELDHENSSDRAVFDRYDGYRGLTIRSYNGQGTHHVIIKNVEVHHIGRTGFYTSGNIEDPQIRNRHLQFIDCYIHHMGNYAYYICAEHITIRGNIIHDCHALAMNMGMDETSGFNNSIIENCIIYDNGSNYHCHKSGCRIMGDGINICSGDNNIIRNNIVYNNRTWGIRVKGIIKNNNIVVNNTIYKNGRQGIYFYDENNIIKNNIVYLNEGRDGYSGEYYIASGNTFDHNLCGVDPRFIDPDNGDFHLIQGSSAINTGTTVPGFNTDIEGNPRDDMWDIGAYEFIIESSFRININANPISGEVPLTVQFISSIFGGTQPYSFHWTFGDGNISILQNPTHTYAQIGLYEATLAVTDSKNRQAVASQEIIVEDNLENEPSIVNIKIVDVKQNKNLNTITPAKWYDLYIYANDPQGWDNVAYIQVWLNHESFKEGTIENRGGKFSSTSNYVMSYSIATNEIWIRETEGSTVHTNVTGRIGLYVDDDNNEYIQNNQQQWAQARIKLLENAKIGNWTINSFVKDKDGNLSDLVMKNIVVQSNDIPSKPKNLKAIFVETP